MFKHHNASPTCIKSNSVEKLKHLGWQTKKPTIACTMEYNPICGVDDMTYWNMYSLNAQHMTRKYHGECIISNNTDNENKNFT